MFSSMKAPAADKIIGIMQAFRSDTRPEKVDLGVGVYKTPDGRTPVMKAVKAAEALILDSQDTKGYVGFAGDPEFLGAMRDLVLGDAVPANLVGAAATPGGTGAVRQVLEMTKNANPDAAVFVSDPSWPNHAGLISYVGLNLRPYRYYDRTTGGLDRDGMWDDLSNAKPGDLILVHGCCHNPTGVDLKLDDWRQLAQICEKTGAIPFVDAAYLGFGAGLEEDTAGLRLLAAEVPEMLIAASCSKNFGLYRDRVGIVMAKAETPSDAETAGKMLGWLNRQNFSFPPDHGARAVQVILGDAALSDMWRDELREMREGMQQSRIDLAEALRRETGSDRFSFLAEHQGMFSLLGGSVEEMVAMRERHGVYLIEDSRMNVAGLTPTSIPIVAKAIANTLK